MGGLKNTYWPDMSTAEAAEAGIKRASNTAYVVAGGTGLLALLAWFDILQLTSPWSLLDAVLFATLGFFISRRSRTAAVLGLGLYLMEVVDRLRSGPGGNMGGYSVLALLFTLFFISGVRGTFSLARLQKEAPPVGLGGSADAQHT
jgi:hypothetical protein